MRKICLFLTAMKKGLFKLIMKLLIWKIYPMLDIYYTIFYYFLLILFFVLSFICSLLFIAVSWAIGSLISNSLGLNTQASSIKNKNIVNNGQVHMTR